MRYFLTAISLMALLAIGALWMTGAFDRLALWAVSQQREFQTGIARALRAVRAGDASAVAALLTACFAYGLAHAAGPGHGKVLIGGYGFARKVPMMRLSLIALLASIGQAVTAVLLVLVGITLFDATRVALVNMTEAMMAPVSYGAITLIGLWLAWRGLRKLIARKSAGQDHGHNHNHGHHDGALVCSSCGHAHGPTLDQVEKAGSLRDALLLIGGIAVRPCTGALFVLIITWQMGILGMGIAGTFAMAVGTALVTIAVGLAAGGLRGGMLAGLGDSPALARTVAVIEVLAGSVVVLIAGSLLSRAI